MVLPLQFSDAFEEGQGVVAVKMTLLFAYLVHRFAVRCSAIEYHRRRRRERRCRRDEKRGWRARAHHSMRGIRAGHFWVLVKMLA